MKESNKNLLWWCEATWSWRHQTGKEKHKKLDRYVRNETMINLKRKRDIQDSRICVSDQQNTWKGIKIKQAMAKRKQGVIRA